MDQEQSTVNNPYDIFTDDTCESNTSPKPSRLKLRTIADIMTAQPIEYLVERIIIPGWVHLLSGPPGVGKSILALTLAKSIVGNA